MLFRSVLQKHSHASTSWFHTSRKLIQMWQYILRLFGRGNKTNESAIVVEESTSLVAEIKTTDSLINVHPQDLSDNDLMEKIDRYQNLGTNKTFVSILLREQERRAARGIAEAWEKMHAEASAPKKVVVKTTPAEEYFERVRQATAISHAKVSRPPQQPPRSVSNRSSNSHQNDTDRKSVV